MSMVSHLANRKWPSNQNNWDRSGVNYHLAHFWSHQKLFTETRSIDAQYFLCLIYSGLRRYFVLDPIIFLVN